MTPQRLLELVEEHLSHDSSKEAHLVLADRIYEESNDELLAAGMRWHSLHNPKNTLWWLGNWQSRLIMAMHDVGKEQLEHERRLTQTKK